MGGQEGRAQTVWESWCSNHPPQYRLCRGGPHTSTAASPLLSTCVCGGGHREAASPPPVPVMRTGCTGARSPVTVREPSRKLTALGLHSPIPSPPQVHGESPQKPVQRSRLLAPRPLPSQNSGPSEGHAQQVARLCCPQTRSCGPGPLAGLEGGRRVSRSYTALGLELSSDGTTVQALLLALVLRRGRLGVSVVTALSLGHPCCSRMSMHSWLPARRA